VDTETRLSLIMRSPTEEIVTLDELRELLETESHPIAYNGFEPSGRAHLGTGLITALKMKDLTQAGVKYKVLLATWHAWLNSKLDGDMKRIRAGAEYLKKVWTLLGVDNSMVEFVDAEKIVDSKEYWEKVMKICTHTTIPRITRTLTILGRTEKEDLKFSMYVYTPMQVADIFELGVQICQLGMDQRKANMLARELGPSLFGYKPVAVHHHILPGLQGPSKMEEEEFSGKMSKSKSGSAIFVEDSEAEIIDKVQKAYCPIKQVEGNPIVEIANYLLLREKKTLKIERDKKFGGDLELSAEELKNEYGEGRLHPLDLKKTVARELSSMLKPCRDYFSKHPEYLAFQESK
jgi:tyrosyl-tRNA synthetase